MIENSGANQGRLFEDVTKNRQLMLFTLCLIPVSSRMKSAKNLFSLEDYCEDFWNTVLWKIRDDSPNGLSDLGITS